MHLTSLYSTKQLCEAVQKQYGNETLIKTSERLNDEGEKVIEITVVKAEAPKTQG